MPVASTSRLISTHFFSNSVRPAMSGSSSWCSTPPPPPPGSSDLRAASMLLLECRLRVRKGEVSVAASESRALGDMGEEEERTMSFFARAPRKDSPRCRRTILCGEKGCRSTLFPQVVLGAPASWAGDPSSRHRRCGRATSAWAVEMAPIASISICHLRDRCPLNGLAPRCLLQTHDMVPHLHIHPRYCLPLPRIHGLMRWHDTGIETAIRGESMLASIDFPRLPDSERLHQIRQNDGCRTRS